MKKSGTIALLACACMLFLSCPNPQTNKQDTAGNTNPFVGTWIQTIQDSSGVHSYSLVFSESTMSCYEDSNYSQLDGQCSYTYTQNHLILKNLLIADDQTYYVTYELNGNTLKFGVKFEGIYDTFTKL